MARIRVATLGGDPEGEASLATALERSLEIDLYIRCVERMEVLAAIRAKSVDVVVFVGVPAWVDGALREELSRNGVSAIGFPRDPLEAVALEDLGASLLEDISDVDSIVAACRSARPPGVVESSDVNEESGRLITCWGTKGAPGRTTLAIELAFVLAGEYPSTILIDGDPSGGDVVQALGVEPGASIIWAAQAMLDERSGAAELERALTRVGQRGPVLIPGLARPALWQDLSVAGWRRLLDWAKTNFWQVVVDTGSALPTSEDHQRHRSREEMNEVALGSSDLVVCVVRADPVGVRNFLCEYPLLEERVDAQRLRLVLNRADGDDARSLAQTLKRETGLYPVAQIPDEPALMRAALKSGRAVVESHPEAELVQQVRDVAVSLGAELRPRSFLAKLVGR